MFSFDRLKLPLIQAPMAGGANTPEMVSTVANSGGVGSYGFTYTTADKIAADLETAADKIDAGGSGAVNANFFVFGNVEMPELAVVEGVLENLVRASRDSEVSFKIPKSPYFFDLTEQLEPVWRARPDIVTFHLGIPSLDIVKKAHELDMAVGITATCIEEARQVEYAGADFIIAQSFNAGGNFGIFDVDRQGEELSIYELVQALSGIVGIPLVAAGGIMNAEHIREALSAGATAVQMGTAFLTTRESGASKAHKRYLLNDNDRATQITRAFSGRPARAISNQFSENMAGKSVLPFPLQNSLTGAMRATAVELDDGEYQSLFAGSKFAECRNESISELLQRLFPY
jgi:nitronate monooxygenase